MTKARDTLGEGTLRKGGVNPAPTVPRPEGGLNGPPPKPVPPRGRIVKEGDMGRVPIARVSFNGVYYKLHVRRRFLCFSWWDELRPVTGHIPEFGPCFGRYHTQEQATLAAQQWARQRQTKRAKWTVTHLEYAE